LGNDYVTDIPDSASYREDIEPFLGSILSSFFSTLFEEPDLLIFVAGLPNTGVVSSLTWLVSVISMVYSLVW
jgi:hypothetical protein